MTEAQRRAYDLLTKRGHYKQIGHTGGMKTRRRIYSDPTYYQRIGQIGGEALLAKGGKDYYRAIRLQVKEAHG